ncbi:MAG: hypothetical protein QMD50_00340 [Patescibacteria group bacterium]|nr:hypothetical protein [Patescibacteria group bacterium]
MERKLKHLAGKRFYIAYNNGVYAIADEKSYHAFLGGKYLIETILSEVSNWNIFIFVRSDRYQRDHWFLGTHEMFERLIQELKNSGARIIDIGQDMYVPFSNGNPPNRFEWHLIRRAYDFFKVFNIRLEEFREEV